MYFVFTNPGTNSKVYIDIFFLQIVVTCDSVLTFTGSVSYEYVIQVNFKGERNQIFINYALCFYILAEFDHIQQR